MWDSIKRWRRAACQILKWVACASQEVQTLFNYKTCFLEKEWGSQNMPSLHGRSRRGLHPAAQISLTEGNAALSEIGEGKPVASSSPKCRCQVMTPSPRRNIFFGRREQGGNRDSHSLCKGRRTPHSGMCTWPLRLARLFLRGIRPLDTYPSFSYSKGHVIVAHSANVNEFIVLWVLSHPFRERAKTGAVPCTQPWGQGQGRVCRQQRSSRGCEKRLRSARARFY